MASPRISFPGKPRKDGSNALYHLPGTDRVFIGKDWALQNEIDETKAATKARSCFAACRTCDACKNSCRDNTYPKSYDANAGKMIDCRACEPFRFHDCHNGLMRDTHQEPELFTEDAQKLFAEGGRPLI